MRSKNLIQLSLQCNFSPLERTHLFWQKNLALLYGLLFFLGVLFFLQTPLTLIFALFIIVSSAKKHVFPLTVTFLLPIALCYHTYFFPSDNSPAQGEFSILSMRENHRFGGGWLIKGTLKTSEGSLRCLIKSKTRPSARYSYDMEGTLFKTDASSYVMKETTGWKIKAKKILPLVEWSFQGKEKMKHYIRKNTPGDLVAQFLIGMVTSELDEKLLCADFNALGLSHLMAISGLHFALIAFTFHFLFSLVFPHKMRVILLIFVLTSYMLFVGFLPSVFRAWLFALVYLFGELLERRPRALNTLGIALLASLLVDMKSATSISFQLSFLATAALIMLLKPVNTILCWWIPKLSLKQIIHHSASRQYGYLVASFFRDALTLTLSVHLVLFPLLLKTFHTFSINSVIYNLFFPALASLALFLFIMGCFFGSWLHALNGIYCTWILKIPQNPPLLFKSWFIESFPSWVLVSYWVILFGWAILITEKATDSGFQIGGLRKNFFF